MNIKRGTFRQGVTFHSDTGAMTTEVTDPEVYLFKPDGSFLEVSQYASLQGTTLMLALDMSNATTYPIGHYLVWYYGIVPTEKPVGTFREFVLSEYSLDDIATLQSQLISSLSRRTVEYTALMDPETGIVEINPGDTYSIARGRSLPFAVADSTHALVLDGGNCTVVLKCSQLTAETVTIASTAEGYDLDFELSGEESARITLEQQPYEIEATWDGDPVETISLGRGTIITVADIPVVDYEEPTP